MPIRKEILYIMVASAVLGIGPASVGLLTSGSHFGGGLVIFSTPLWYTLELAADAVGVAVLILIAKGKIGLGEVHTSERYKLLFVLGFSLVVLLVVSLILLGLR